ncbi:unnamed protein product [Sympodiomycopsis kandeliae]
MSNCQLTSNPRALPTELWYKIVAEVVKDDDGHGQDWLIRKDGCKEGEWSTLRALTQVNRQVRQVAMAQMWRVTRTVSVLGDVACKRHAPQPPASTQKTKRRRGMDSRAAARYAGEVQERDLRMLLDRTGIHQSLISMVPLPADSLVGML